MLTRSKKAAILSAIIVVLAAPAAPMALSFSADFLWNPDPDNETQVYLHVANTAFNQPRSEVEKIFPKIDNPESDFAIFLFMASEGHCSLTRVFTLRSKGMSWIQVMAKLGIPKERVFVESSRDPGPPYGRPYGHWKNRQSEDLLVRDDDVAYWVNVRTMSTFFGTSPSTVQDWRDSGRTWKAIAKGEYKNFKKGGKKMDKAGVGSDAKGGSPGKGKGRDKGN